jgi:hypothetical protein
MTLDISITWRCTCLQRVVDSKAESIRIVDAERHVAIEKKRALCCYSVHLLVCKIIHGQQAGEAADVQYSSSTRTVLRTWDSVARSAAEGRQLRQGSKTTYYYSTPWPPHTTATSTSPSCSTTTTTLPYRTFGIYFARSRLQKESSISGHDQSSHFSS